MGHTRLGAIPKTRKWNELVQQVAGLGLTGNVAAAAASIDAIAAQTLDAAQKSLDRAAQDSGVCYTFYLITQLAHASRTSDWEGALSEHGITLSHVNSVFDFTSEVHDAIDRYISRNPFRATDLSEIAQQSAGEAITSLAGSRTASLFSGSSADVQDILAKNLNSTERGTYPASLFLSAT